MDYNFQELKIHFKSSLPRKAEQSGPAFGGKNCFDSISTILHYNNSSSSLKQPNMAPPSLLRALGGRVYVNCRVSDITNPGSSLL